MPVPGKRYRPDSWNETVRTPGSSRWIAWTPSPWWTSRSTYRTRSPSRRARRDRERRVVVDAEAGGAIGHRVVEAAAGVEGVLDVAAEDRLHGAQRTAGHRGARLVHAGEWRIVARPDPGVGRSPRLIREAPDRRDVAGGVAGEKLLVGRRLGREPGLGPDRAKQLDPGPESPRREGMDRPEVVGRRAGAVDEQRSVGHLD